jgi:anaerobic magnesium-protoporphyrin IX monomethyl ester cyclase
MRILLINPPYQTFTCNLGVGHHVPLGLLMVGGPLVDAGHEVTLLDAEVRRLSDRRIVAAVQAAQPDVVMTGHSGSTPAHPTAMRMLRSIRTVCPQVRTVYGGVHPTFHAQAILEAEPAVDVIVRGEGELTALELVDALQQGCDLSTVPSLAFRTGDRVVLTRERAPLDNLDDFRVGWELVEEWRLYRTLDFGTSAVVQWSRGCPHLCTYCGQRTFWRTWRHRDAKRVVDDIELLHRRYGVRFLHLGDDDPAADQAAWLGFLEELAARKLPVFLHATTRADEVVRDAEHLPLYRRAGVLYILLGMESTDGDVLEAVRKRSSLEADALAPTLMREAGIFSVVGQVVGLREETWAGFDAALRQLIRYDSDWVNVMYATPHAWSEFGDAAAPQTEPDLSKWDYRHPVVRQGGLKPWQLVLAAKWLELRYHARPSKLWRILTTRDPFYRKELLCALSHTTPIWWAELFESLGWALFRAGRGPAAAGEER